MIAKNYLYRVKVRDAFSWKEQKQCSIVVEGTGSQLRAPGLESRRCHYTWFYSFHLQSNLNITAWMLKSKSNQVNPLLKILQLPLDFLRVIAKVNTKTLHNPSPNKLPLKSSSTLSSSLSLFKPNQLLCCFLIMEGILMPQGFCISCVQCLKYPYPRYPHGSLPYLLVSLFKHQLLSEARTDYKTSTIFQNLFTSLYIFPQHLPLLTY